MALRLNCPRAICSVVCIILAFIANNSGKDSTVIFDYICKSLLDGTSDSEEAKKARKAHDRRGESNTFGIEEGTIEEFLINRGFYQIRHITHELVEGIYFKGNNRNMKSYRLFALVHATVGSEVDLTSKGSTKPKI